MELTFAQENLISDLAVDEKREREDDPLFDSTGRTQAEREEDMAAYLCELPKEERAMILAKNRLSYQIN